MVTHKKIVWMQRPAEIVAAVQTGDHSFVDLTSRYFGHDTWSGSEFIGRLIQFQPVLGAWFVDVGQVRPALVSAKHMERFGKQHKLKINEGLYAPFSVVAEPREDKGLRLMPILRLPTKAERAKGAHCSKDLRDPIQRLAQLHGLEANKAQEVSPTKESRLYGELQAAWHQAIEPELAFSGGTLKIEPTAAITSIDVNGLGIKQDEAIALNEDASSAIAKAVLSRNISGQILIDFVSMQSKKDRLSVLETLKSCFKNDTRKLNWGGVDGFSCLLMTRQRLGPSIYEHLMQPASAPETGWRLTPERRLIDFLDQVYRNKRTSQTWAKRETLQLSINTNINADFLEHISSWMSEIVFVDLKTTQKHEAEAAVSSPEFQLIGAP